MEGRRPRASLQPFEAAVRKLRHHLRWQLEDGAFEVGVRMFGAHLDGEDEWFTEPLFEENIVVGPGTDMDGDPRLVLVTSGRPGFAGA